MTRTTFIIVTVGGLVLAACTSDIEKPQDPNAAANTVPTNSKCWDLDRDGYGKGCANGPDCNDNDPLLGLECGVEKLGPCTTGATQACYSLTSLEGDKVQCKSGARTCVNGRWSKCDMTKTYTKKISSRSALRLSAITAPTQCNACDPACYLASDTPDAADLTPANSTGLTYDGMTGGVTITGGGGGAASTGPDSDGDGVADAFDQYPADPACDGYTKNGAACAQPENGGIYHVLPLNAPAVSNDLDIVTNVRSADVYFLMDTTQSMQQEIDTLKNALIAGNWFPADQNPAVLCPGLVDTTGLVGAIQCNIADARFGVGYFDDYPIPPYGQGGATYGGATNACADGPTGTQHDVPYFNLLNISPAETPAQRTAISTQVNRLVAKCGGDKPESQVPALFSISTGACLPDTRPWYPNYDPATIYPNRIPFVEKTGSVASPVLTARAVNVPNGNASVSSYTTRTVDGTAAGAGDLRTAPINAGALVASEDIVVNSTTAGKAVNGNNVCGATNQSRDVYVQFNTALTTGTFIATTVTLATWNTVLDRVNPANGASIPLACNDNYGGTSQSYISWPASAGTHMVRVTGNGSANGAFGLFIRHVPPAAPPAPGDTLSNAYDIGTLSKGQAIDISVNLNTFNDDASLNGIMWGVVAPGPDVALKVVLTEPMRIKLTQGFALTNGNDALATADVWFEEILDASVTPPVVDSRGAFRTGWTPGWGSAARNETRTADWENSEVPAGDYLIVINGSPAVQPYRVRISDTTSDTLADPIANIGDITNTTRHFDERMQYFSRKEPSHVASCDNGPHGNPFDMYVRFTVSADKVYAFEAETTEPVALEILKNDGTCLISTNSQAGNGGGDGKDQTQRQGVVVNTRGTPSNRHYMPAMTQRLTPGTYMLKVRANPIGGGGAYTNGEGVTRVYLGPATAENFAQAYDLGDLSNQFYVALDTTGNQKGAADYYFGDEVWTDAMAWQRTDDYPLYACGASDLRDNTGFYNPDSVYKFTLSAPTTIMLSSQPYFGYSNFIVQLRDSNFNPIICDDTESMRGTIFRHLDAGTYYVLHKYTGKNTDDSVHKAQGSFPFFGGDYTKHFNCLTPKQTTCPAGTWGYPCFRDGTVPIVVMFSDATFHGGPGGGTWVERYGQNLGDDIPAPRFEATTQELRRRGVKVIGINSGDAKSTVCTDVCGTTRIENQCANQLVCTKYDAQQYQDNTVCSQGSCYTYRAVASKCLNWVNQWTCADRTVCNTVVGQNCSLYDQNNSHYHMDQTAQATATLDENGNSLVYDIAANGTGLTSAVVTAINKLANQTRMDITLAVDDNPATVGVDERQFVKSITAVPTATTNGRCQTTHATWFEGCLPGTQAVFAVSFRNDFIAHAAVVQSYTFNIRTVGDALYTLNTTPVRIVIPNNGGATLASASGSYWRDYGPACSGTLLPSWETLSWVAPSVPAGTSIRFEVRTATTQAALAASAPVTVTAPPGTSPVQITPLLAAAGLPIRNQWLRVTAVLNGSADLTQSPVLTGFNTQYRCDAND